MFFSCSLKVHIVLIMICIPILSFLFLHSPTLSCWWHTCWSGVCALMRIVDAKDLMYDVWLCNLMSICSVSRNIRNTCMKGLHSPCSWITSFQWIWLQYWSSFVLDLYEDIYMSFMMMGKKYMMYGSVILCQYSM